MSQDATCSIHAMQWLHICWLHVNPWSRHVHMCSHITNILSHFAFMIVYRCICAHSSFVAHSCVFYVQSLCACTHNCTYILSCITINKHLPHQCMSMVDDAYVHLCISVCKQHSFHSHFLYVSACWWCICAVVHHCVQTTHISWSIVHFLACWWCISACVYQYVQATLIS